MPASPPSRATHAQSNAPIHDSWVRNYESVEYDVPLLHPQAALDSGDEEEEEKGASGKREMPSQTDQPPRTPPKNPSLSPKSVKGNASADSRLPTPGRSPSHIRGPSSQSSTSSTQTKSAQQQSYPSAGQQLYASALGTPVDMNVVADKQSAAGSIGSITTGNVTDFSHQSSLSTTTATAGGLAQTATPTSRSLRSPSFRSSPLAASVSSSIPAPGVKNPNSQLPQATPSTVRIPPTSFKSKTSSSMSSSSFPKAAMNTSPPMSNPHSMGTSSSSSSTPPSSFFSPQQGSSSTQHPPTMPNTPYSPVPHPNANNPPFAKPGTRPNPGPTNNNNNNSHMNPAYIQRIASEENRVFGGPQVAPGQGAGPDGGSGRGSPHSQSTFVHAGASGAGVGLRDPGFSGNNSHHNNNQHPQLNTSGSRGSMILYRLSATEDGMLPPPGVPGSAGRRGSVYSNSGDSIVSLSGDSKYPLVGFGGSGTRTPGTPGRPGTPGTPGNGSIGNRGGPLSMSEIGKVHGGLVAYMYDPGQDLDADELDEEEEDWVKTVGGHVIRGDVKGLGTFGNANMRMNVNKGKANGKAPIRTSKQTPPSSSGVPWRGLVNVTTLVVLILGLLCLFLLYPVWRAYNNNGVEQLILGNTRINSTGQAVSLEAVDKRDWKLPEFNRDLH